MKQDPHVSEIVWNHLQTTYFCMWLKDINHKLSNKHVFLFSGGHQHEKKSQFRKRICGSLSNLIASEITKMLISTWK